MVQLSETSTVEPPNKIHIGTLSETSTVEPPNKIHIGTSCFVQYREVVLFSGGLKMYYCYAL